MSFLFANSGDVSTPAPPTDTLTQAIRERDSALEQLARFREHHLAETCKQTKEILDLRADAEALAKALEELCESGTHAHYLEAEAALDTYRARHTKGTP